MLTISTAVVVPQNTQSSGAGCGIVEITGELRQLPGNDQGVYRPICGPNMTHLDLRFPANPIGLG